MSLSCETSTTRACINGRIFAINPVAFPDSVLKSSGVALTLELTIPAQAQVNGVAIWSLSVDELANNPNALAIMAEISGWPTSAGAGTGIWIYEDMKQRILRGAAKVQCAGGPGDCRALDRCNVCYIGPSGTEPLGLRRITPRVDFQLGTTTDVRHTKIWSVADILADPNPGDIVRDVREAQVFNSNSTADYPTGIWGGNGPNVDSATRLRASHFAQPINSPACVGIFPSYLNCQPNPACNSSYNAYYATRCLPVLATDINGIEANLYGKEFPTQADAVMDQWCSTDVTGNPNDPRCACHTGLDPTGYYATLTGENGVSLPPSCWFVPCKNPHSFYNPFSPADQCEIPPCSQFQTVIVKDGGIWVDNDLTQSIINCTGGSQQPSGPVPLNLVQRTAALASQYGVWAGAGLAGIVGLPLLIWGIYGGGGAKKKMSV